MRNLFHQINLMLTAVGAILLSCSIFQGRSDLAYGELVGQLSGFRYALLFFAVCVLLLEVTGPTHKFTFSLPDGLLVVLFGWAFFSYDRELDLQPGKILFISELLLLWFLIRVVFQRIPTMRFLFLLIFICMGLLTSVWSLIHVYGNATAGRSIFREIDFAFHAGPVAGYLALLLPLCLSLILRLRNCRKLRLNEPGTGLYYLAWIGFVLLFAGIAACNDRVAWVASLGASAWVGWMQITGWAGIKRTVRRHRIFFALSSLFMFFFVVGLPEAARLLKLEAPGQRSLMWNVTAQAILEYPFIGTGIGSYPVRYAKAQSAYFASGMASDTEQAAASYPAFASNEYLHIGLELGIVGLLLFLLWIGFTLYYGIRHRMAGTCGSFLALAILGMYGAPLQLPSFWILFIILSAICVTDVTGRYSPVSKAFPYIGALTAAVCLVFLGMHKNPVPLYKEWKTLERLYEKGHYRVAAEGYRYLYPDLCHRSEFLKEGAHCLQECGEMEEAARWIDRALLLSADPALFYFKAELNRRIRAYPEAEACLKEVIGILPKRTESYFRLARLYTDSGYYRPEELKATVRQIVQLQLQGTTKEIRELKRRFREWESAFSSALFRRGKTNNE